MGNGTLATSFSGPPFGEFGRHNGDIIGNSDSSVGLASLWLNPALLNLSYNIVAPRGLRVDIRYDAGVGQKMRVILFDASNTKIMEVRSLATPLLNAWNHFIVSWDLGGTPTVKAYLNDVKSENILTLTTGIADWTPAQPFWGIAGNFNGAGRMKGCLSEIYVRNDVFLDLDVMANRRLFNDGMGSAVELGSAGEIPTGTSPLLYFPAADGVNAGTGGSFIHTSTGFNIVPVVPCATTPTVVPTSAFDLIEIIRDEMIAFPTGTQKFNMELQQAIDSLNAALSFLAGGNPRFAAKQVRKAIKNVLFLTDKGLLNDLQGLDWNQRLTLAIRIEVVDAIDEAVARTGDPVEIALANDFLDEGDLEASMGLGFFDDAVKEYEKAILHGELA